MALIYFGQDHSIDMRGYTFQIDSLSSLSTMSLRPTWFRGTSSDGKQVSMSGEGFHYDTSTGLLDEGEIHALRGAAGLNYYFSIADLHLAADDLTKVVRTESKTDDLSLVKSFLSGNDFISGSQYADVLLGYAGDDNLNGAAGNDKLYGSNGNDVLNGGMGHDYLTGGAGSDTFKFHSVSDSVNSSAGRDTIYDFSSEDRINLGGIDGNENLIGNQSFTFIGKAVFHGIAGELRFDKRASDTYIYGDVNGDSKADFAIHLDDAVDIFKAYFIL